jgi:DNA-binding transcriptional ArsR family regulator/uncharacterized protein YndB with AHSA1/START domain
MDDVFKALSDPTRRKLLDLLRDRDGRTVSELETEIDMTRFGVMKHLKVLEEAHLITARKSGRFKYVYLNAGPLQGVVDRWIAPYMQPWIRMTATLKTHLEQDPMSEKPAFVQETYIRTSPERLWEALTSPDDTQAYYFGTRVQSDWAEGADLKYLDPEGKLMLSGRVLEIDPPKRLVTTFQPGWCDGEGDAKPESRVTYEIEPMGDVCRLTLSHYGLSEEDMGIRTGWARIINSLKSLLETGKPLTYPPLAS